jgi:hypothetical protein
MSRCERRGMRLFMVFCAALLVGAAPAFALDEGAIDGTRHPYVGQTGVDFDGPGAEPATAWCTGSVVSDRVVLTAGHCVAGLPPESEFSFTAQAGSPARPVATPGLYPDGFPFTFNVATVKAEAAVTHPQFDAETRAHDVAVLLFEPGTFAGVAPLALPRERRLDREHRAVFRLVGYGVDPEYGDELPQLIYEGYRQTRTTTFQRLLPTQLVLAGGGCDGDSGSPQLLDGLAVSVLSDAGAECRGPLVAQRLDTRAELKFLRRYL